MNDPDDERSTIDPAVHERLAEQFQQHLDTYLQKHAWEDDGGATE